MPGAGQVPTLRLLPPEKGRPAPGNSRTGRCGASCLAAKKAEAERKQAAVGNQNGHHGNSSSIRTVADLPQSSDLPIKQRPGEAGLPPIRFHDLRHRSATLSLAAGVDIKVVQEMLGHSTSAFTRDVYTSVVPEIATAAAEAVAAIVPRRANIVPTQA